jgi:hypothetical protein
VRPRTLFCQIVALVLFTIAIVPLIANAQTSINRRPGATTTPLPDGRVIVTGGETAAGISQTIEILDATSSTSGFKGLLSLPRKNHAAAVLLDGRVLITGGSFGGIVPSAMSDFFDPQTNTTIPGPRLDVGRAKHSATTLPNGDVLIVGGVDGVHELTSAEIYDSSTGAFRPAGDLNFARSGHSAVLLPNGDVRISGGSKADEIYHIRNGVFTVETSVIAGCSAAPASGEIDLTAATACAQDANGSILRTSGFTGSTGTGVFKSFVRIQKTGTEHGYNTSGTLEFDELKSANFTKDLLLADVPIIMINGTGYRQFRLDINENSSSGLLSLDVVRVYLHNTANITGYNTGTHNFSTPVPKIWELNAATYAKLDYNNFPGSGNGDLELLVPNTLFTGCSGTCYVTLYSEFGGHYSSDAGFEEWSVLNSAAVLATKTVNPSYDRTYSWTIDKTANPTAWNLFKGDSGTSAYNVSVNSTFQDSNFKLTGTLSLFNGSASGIRVQTANTTDQIGIVTLADVSGTMTPIGSAVISNCNTAVLVNPGGNTLPSGQTYHCDYTFAFAGAPPVVPPGSTLANRVTFVTGTGQGVPTAYTEIFSFGLPTNSQNQTVHITDKFDSESPVSLGAVDAAADSLPVVFHPAPRTFACDTDAGAHTNTAKITETNQTSSASVTVNCYSLSLTKTAATAFKHKWSWTIQKSVDPNSLTLNQGEIQPVGFSVTVNATSADSDWIVTGGITVNNPSPVAATLNSVSDVVSGAGAATVDCGVTFPHIIAAGGALNCTYSKALSDATSHTNTATGTLQNHSFSSQGTPTNTGTTDFTGTADVNFAGAVMQEIDECIDVSDTDKGSLGTVCAAGGLPHTFKYQLTFGAAPTADIVLVCGPNQHTNTASFQTNDTQAKGSAGASVNATVQCAPINPTGPDDPPSGSGCTYSFGYWKTHNDAFHGGAKPDPTWQLIGASAENTIFFLSGQTYFETLWTNPSGGNGYYILNHQYIAAKLNGLNGATMPSAVQTAFNSATSLFNTYTPAQIGALKGGDSLRQQFITLGGILEGFNTGATGPGHCKDED